MPRSRHQGLLVSAALAALLLPAGRASASGASAGLSRLLDGLPAERIESGILYDRVLSLSRVSEHDGSAGSRPATFREWAQMYDEMTRASLREPAWPRLSALVEGARAQEGEGVHPIVIMNFVYDRIREDAMESGALVPQGDRVTLGSGDPFLTGRVFAASTVRERAYHGERVVFRARLEDYHANDGSIPRALEIDFGDGRGFGPVPFDREWPVRYDAVGRKEIRLRLTFADGAKRLAAFPLEVISLSAPLPNDTLHVTASIPYLGQLGQGDAYVYLAASHAALTNPVVVAEGFDLDNSMNWDELYALLNREQLLENLRAGGFDLVVLNFTDATDYVQRNAFVLVELIEEVEAMTDAAMRSAVVGASMGGLVARYALAYMENNGLPHRVRTFISFDSPQEGANIPLGIQYWVAFFASDSPDAAALLAALDAPAARQMLTYHHTEPPGPTGESDPLRTQLLTEIAAVGSYPAVPRIVGISNGSGAAAGQGFNPGAQIVQWHYNSLFVDVTGDVWAVPNASSQTVFHGLIRILFSTDEQFVTVSGTRPFDNAPGGSRASMAQMDSVPAPYGDIIALHGSHDFIPTVSALDIDTQDLFYNVANDPNVLDHTPFDAVYFPQANQEHVLITPENAAWVTGELMSGVTGVAGAPSGTAPLALSATPNPFSSRVTLGLTGAGPAGAGRLSVFDVTGRAVRSLPLFEGTAGGQPLAWDGRGDDGRLVPEGVYVIRLESAGGTVTGKVVRLAP